MRILLFFDLPSISSEEKREYLNFRKHLLKNGFFMLQESVYCKLALNPSVANAVFHNLENSKPKKGLIQILMILLLGSSSSEVLNSDQRLVIL